MWFDHSHALAVERGALGADRPRDRAGGVAGHFGSILYSHQKAMIAGGSIHADTSGVDSAVRRLQSWHPSLQPFSSLPTPAQRAMSLGKVMAWPPVQWRALLYTPEQKPFGNLRLLL